MECHPLNQQIEAKKWNDKYGIQLEAWAPFGEGRGGLFDTVNFSGKTVVPFNTHMGSRDGGTYKTFREKARGATAGKRRSGFSHFAVLRGSFLRLRFGTASQVLQSLAHLTSGDGRKSSMAEKRTRIFGWNE